MHKTFAITKDISGLSSFRHQWLHDSTLGIYFVCHWPRNLQEQLAFEKLSNFTHLPHSEDQMKLLDSAVVDQLPGQAGVTTSDNSYQGLMKLFNHYQWNNFHPHQ